MRGNFLRTIEVGALGVDGRDLSNREVEGRGQSRLVRHLFEALQRGQRLQSALLGSRHLTFTAVIHSARSSSERDLHSRLTRGSAQEAAYTVVRYVRRRAKNTFLVRLAVILGDR